MKQKITLIDNNPNSDSLYYNTPRAWNILKKQGESLNFKLAIDRHSRILNIETDTPNDQEFGAKVRRLLNTKQGTD